MPVVFDHFANATPERGVEQPGFGDLVELVRSGKAWVKISVTAGPRTDYSPFVPLAKTLKYHEVARACGYPRAYAYDNLETFSINIERILSEPGPVFIALKVKPDIENKPIGSRVRWRKRSQVQVVADLKKELGIA